MTRSTVTIASDVSMHGSASVEEQQSIALELISLRRELLSEREAQSKQADLYLCRVTRGGEELYSPCGKDYPRGRGYFTAPPTPASLDFGKLAKEIVENLVDCGPVDDDLIAQYEAFVQKTCRAAMLGSRSKSS
ncbi:hypothetical protein [Serratia silvae]|uniref:Uncharacterized protein n=1 Tax=Serratia silvae TaxID=2824122 RepID=A0ABT0KH24_9GAMM|nr:hypothetical protein [Serratia silvae]MCL1031330.1 hypothetical protein [Serratia silvae]